MTSLLVGLGLVGSGLAVGLAAYRGVTIGASALALAVAHWYAWRRGVGGRTTRALLVAASAAAPVLWWTALRH